MTRVSRSRRCAIVSGTASSRIWRTLKACASAVFALTTAWLNGAVSCRRILRWPKPIRCHWCAPRCRRRPPWSWTGRRARRSEPTPARSGRRVHPVRGRELGLPARRRRRACRTAITASTSRTRTATATSRPTAARFRVPELPRVLSPLAAATAAPAQSLRRSAGSIASRRRLSAVADCSSGDGSGPPGTHRTDPSVATASRASSSLEVAGSPVLSAQLTAASWPSKSVDVDHPQPDAGGRCRACRRPVHLARLGAAQHAGVVGDVVRQPERGCAAARWARDRSPGGQDRENQAEQAGDTHDASM